MDNEIIFKQKPVLWVRVTECPITDSSQSIIFYSIKFCLCTPGILKPNFMSSALGVSVPEKWGLSYLIILDCHTILNGTSDSLLLTECFSLLPLDMRKKPIAGINLESEKDFVFWNDRYSIIQDSSYLIKR